MSLTLDDIARRALATIVTDAGQVLAVQWASKRLNQLIGHNRFRSFRKLGEIVVPKLIDGGTVAVTQGSRTVTGDATTAQGEWSVEDLVGMYLKVDDQIYEIVGQDATTVTLASDYTEDTNATASYKIIPRFLELAENVRWIGQVMNEDYVLTGVSFELMNELYAGMESTGIPHSWAVGPVSAEGRKTIQIWPHPKDDDVLLRYSYWPGDTEFRGTDKVPEFLPSHILEQGVLIDLFRYEMSKAARAGEVQQAALWRNESRAQETVWRRTMQEVARADRTADDTEFLLGRGPLHRPNEIRNAREEVAARMR